jgi:hypothetical protein
LGVMSWAKAFMCAVHYKIALAYLIKCFSRFDGDDLELFPCA